MGEPSLLSVDGWHIGETILQRTAYHLVLAQLVPQMQEADTFELLVTAWHTSAEPPGQPARPSLTADTEACGTEYATLQDLLPLIQARVGIGAEEHESFVVAVRDGVLDEHLLGASCTTEGEAVLSLLTTVAAAPAWDVLSPGLQKLALAVYETACAWQLDAAPPHLPGGEAVVFAQHVLTPLGCRLGISPRAAACAELRTLVRCYRSSRSAALLELAEWAFFFSKQRGGDLGVGAGGER